jgi:hypothetical protein
VRTFILLACLCFGAYHLARAQELPAPSRAVRCAVDGRRDFPWSSPDSLTRTWFGRLWDALQEADLCTDVGEARQVYRFLWVPTFDPVVAIEIREEAGTHRLRAKRLTGAGGYELGHLAVDTSFSMTPADWANFSRLVRESGFLADSGVFAGPLGLDGAQWILEWAGGKRHYVVDRWSPDARGPAAAYRRVGEWLLHRSGLVPDSLVVGY